LKPEPVAPGKELEHRNDDTDSEDQRAPYDPAVEPVAPWRIRVGPPAHHQAHGQRGGEPTGVTDNVEPHGCAPLLHDKLDASILRASFRRIIAGDRLGLAIAGRCDALDVDAGLAHVG